MLKGALIAGGSLLGHRTGAYILYAILLLLRTTIRITYEGREILVEQVRRGEGFIGVFWHGRMLMIPFLYPGRKMHVLISTHRDGEIIAKVMQCFGFGLVRGSSTRRGKAALKEVVRLLKDNHDLAITPDGPKGPCEELKLGTVQAARLSGKSVIPVAFSSSRCWKYRSWDSFLIPKPFSRVVFVVGEPIRCCPNDDPETSRLKLQQALREVTRRADSYFMHRGEPGSC